MSREQVPRQATQSLSTAAITSILTSTNVVSTQVTTSLLAPTSVLSSLHTSSVTSLDLTTSSSSSTEATTTTTTTTTTSTPQHTSQPTTSASPTTQTRSTFSSSSTSPRTSSSAAPSTSFVSSSSSSSFSSFVPTSTTTTIPSSSSQQVIVTSTYTTYINGSPLLTQTTFPSTIPQISTSASSDRTAIIAGCAAGGTALLILLLSLAFYARRKQFKRLDFIRALTLKRKQERSRATFLDGEDLDDVDLALPPRRYTDYETPWGDGSQRALMGGRGTPGTSGTVHWSENGSSFREELWPPAADEGTRLLTDPLVHRHDPDLDLGHIVDNVMGPSTSAVHFSDQSISSIYRGSIAESEGAVHSRTVSDASNAALLDVAGLGGPSSSNAPVRSSPLAQPGTKPGPGSVEQRSGEGTAP